MMKFKEFGEPKDCGKILNLKYPKITKSDYRKMVPTIDMVIKDYDSVSQILDRVVRNLEYLNDMTNGELDDCDDISKLKIQVKSIKNLIGVD